MVIRIFINPEGLKHALLKRGWTQGKLAVRVQVSPKTITRWLKRERALGPETAQRVQQVLRIRWDELFGSSEVKFGKDIVLLERGALPKEEPRA